MANHFVQTVTHPKIGVAIPIANPSFEFWTDSAMTADCQHWAEQGGIVAARKENVSGVTNASSIADEGSALQISGSAIPNNDTMRIQSPAMQYWHANGPRLPGALVVYYSLYMHIATITTPGGSAQIRLAMETDDNEAMSSVAQTNLIAWTATNGGLLRYAGNVVSAMNANDIFARFWIRLRDAAAMTVIVDDLGCMFDPFSNSGYTQLTNVFPANGPEFFREGYTERSRGVGGVMRKFDISGGAMKYIIDWELSQEDAGTYETLRRYRALCEGAPGRPPLPLGIEMNVPGLPPYMMVDMTKFGLRRTGTTEFYGGVITLETIW